MSARRPRPAGREVAARSRPRRCAAPPEYSRAAACPTYNSRSSLSSETPAVSRRSGADARHCPLTRPGRGAHPRKPQLEGLATRRHAGRGPPDVRQTRNVPDWAALLRRDASRAHSAVDHHPTRRCPTAHPRPHSFHVHRSSASPQLPRMVHRGSGEVLAVIGDVAAHHSALVAFHGLEERVVTARPQLHLHARDDRLSGSVEESG